MARPPARIRWRPGGGNDACASQASTASRRTALRRRPAGQGRRPQCTTRRAARSAPTWSAAAIAAVARPSSGGGGPIEQRRGDSTERDLAERDRAVAGDCSPTKPRPSSSSLATRLAASAAAEAPGDHACAWVRNPNGE